MTAVRRRRGELAVLKTLGFSRHQVRATIAWQASTVAWVGLVIGLPLGLVAGRVVWLAVADELGVSTDPTWPVLGVLLLVPAAFLAVNVIALFPADRAANTLPGCRPEERVMPAVLMLGRAELRRRWRSVVVLTLLVGFAGAVALALFAGARRTETALARFESVSRSANVEIDAGDTTPAQLAEFRRTPGVAEVGQLHQVTLVSSGGQFLPAAAQVDNRFGRVIDRSRIIAGRAADLRVVDELDIGEGLAEQLHLKVGDRLSFNSMSPADVRSQEPVVRPGGPRVTFRIVGIVRRPLDLGGRGAAGGVIVLTPAFLARYGDQIGSYSGTVLRVRTEDASDVATVSQAARRIFGAANAFSFTSLSVEGQAAQNVIDVTTVGLYIAAGVAILTALVGIGIALSREIALGDAQQLTLSALGMRPRHRVAAAAAIALPIATVGAVLAFVGAVLASPIFPIGVAGKAEPDPGLRLDGVTVGVGFIAVVVVVLVIALLAGLRTAGATGPVQEAARPGLAAAWPNRVAPARPSRSECDLRSIADSSVARCRCGRRCSVPHSASWSSWRCSCSRPASTTSSRHPPSSGGRGT